MPTTSPVTETTTMTLSQLNSSQFSPTASTTKQTEGKQTNLPDFHHNYQPVQHSDCSVKLACHTEHFESQSTQIDQSYTDNTPTFQNNSGLPSFVEGSLLYSQQEQPLPLLPLQQGHQEQSLSLQEEHQEQSLSLLQQQQSSPREYEHQRYYTPDLATQSNKEQNQKRDTASEVIYSILSNESANENSLQENKYAAKESEEQSEGEYFSEHESEGINKNVMLTEGAHSTRQEQSKMTTFQKDLTNTTERLQTSLEETEQSKASQLGRKIEQPTAQLMDDRMLHYKSHFHCFIQK